MKWREKWREILDTRARRDAELDKLEEVSRHEEQWRQEQPYSESDAFLAQNARVAEIEDSLPWWARWRW